ncbi:hypothetical protein DEO72_LG1g2140 [Vigna unguiculata]|uniref:Uncharacterized protein n=1 Tax=Vigna unguiculata TaxID=3917 RepID=A0A4D6KKH6_VIGUN|nr:hypothetical protein DEO72_LG1g2140 [Vigna unguiculata]
MKIEDGGCHGEANGVVRAGSDACGAAVADGVTREDERSGCRQERRGAVVFVTALLRTPARLVARLAAAMVMEGEEEN